MRCPVATLRLRAYIHATEEADRVLAAVRNVTRGAAVIVQARGHHGNAIDVVEVELHGCEALEALRNLIKRLDGTERALLLSGVDADDLVLRVKLDKQAAYLGRLRPASGGDVIVLEAKFNRSVVKDVVGFLMTQI